MDNWQAAARRMRSQGKSADEIATLTGQSSSTVREALRGTPRLAAADDDAKPLGAGRAERVEAHVPRVPRAILDQGAKASGTLAFARGEIDRAELMRRISR